MHTNARSALISWTSLLAMSAAAFGGCTTSTSTDQDTTAQEAIASANGLSMVNGLSMTNGLASNNGLSMTNGLSTSNGLSMTNGLMTTADGRNTVAYLVRCALAAGDSVVKKDQNGVYYTFPGAIGVAPQWKNGACDTNCQENVSACLMAHVNTTGKHVALWLDGTSPAIGWGRNNSYPMQESAFFGNIFTSPPHAYFCNGFDWDRGPAAGRIGANQAGSPYTNPFGTNQLCQYHCSRAGYLGQEYGSCDGYNNVVTVYRDFDPTMAYNICNAASGLCFDIANKSTAAGAIIDQSPRNGNDSQKFFIERVSADSDSGKYRIHAKLSGLYLDMAGGATGNGGGVIQWGWSGAANQQWWLIQIITSDYLFENVNSARLLDGTTGVAGKQIIQNGTGSYTDSQMWRIMIAQ